MKKYKAGDLVFVVNDFYRIGVTTAKVVENCETKYSDVWVTSEEIAFRYKKSESACYSQKDIKPLTKLDKVLK